MMKNMRKNKIRVIQSVKGGERWYPVNEFERCYKINLRA